jgi:hypothetical protein
MENLKIIGGRLVPEKERNYNTICTEMEKLSRPKQSDTDEAHITADKLLVEALSLLGAKRLVKAYEKVEKWYS